MHRLLCFSFVVFLLGCDSTSSPAKSFQENTNTAVKGNATPPKIEKARQVLFPKLPGIKKSSEALSQDLNQEIAAHGRSYEPRTKHKSLKGSPKYTNRLIKQKSPYLLQHAHNPVNWYSWSEEAFEDARALNRPVFLSIGYSTCHWCHVMEEESFEDVEIAAFINANFIPIKVDREERPDVDDVYMKAVNLLTGRGGWPMTVVLTPEKEPFFGGTYFPPRDGVRGAKRGFLTILKELSGQYENSPDEVVARAKKVSERMQQHAQPMVGERVPEVSMVLAVAEQFTKRFDPVYGGFGGAPKFPTPVNLEFLLRAYVLNPQEEKLKSMVVHTLTKMSEGGIFDHVGGGFHRYSVDARWQVPHFEKMLYDNAQLIAIYAKAYQLTRDKRFAHVARRTADYVLREMRDPQTGGFYSATDADSLTPGGEREEGYYFTWTVDELKRALTPEQFEVVQACYKLPEGGNFEGRIILEPTSSCDLLGEKLAQVNQVLLDQRNKRPKPGLDDKVLTSWNALIISALAQVGWVLGEPRYIDAARQGAVFVMEQMRAKSGELYRSLRAGEVTVKQAFLDDYAFMVAACLDLFEVTGEVVWMKEAKALQGIQDEMFRDPKDGLYFMASKKSSDLITRNKPTYDGAQPSGNAKSVMNLMRLYHLTFDETFKRRAEQVLSASSRTLGIGSSATMSALTLVHGKPKEVVLSSPSRELLEQSKLLGVLKRRYLPQNSVILRLDGDTEIDQRVPVARAKRSAGGKVRAFVCELGRCELPTTDVKTFIVQLER